MTTDWKLLTPHRPLDPASPKYVRRPTGEAAEIAARVLAGNSAILLGGPAGIGKSTELAQAGAMLRSERVACLVPLDRWENMRQLEPERLALRLAGRLVHVAAHVLNLPISTQLRELLVYEGVLEDGGIIPPRGGFSASARTALRGALSEVSRVAHQKRVAFLIDGLEKVGPDRFATLFEELSALPDSVDVVVIVPWFASFGARADSIVRPGERFVALRAIEAGDNEEGAQGRELLGHILELKLDVDLAKLDQAVREVVDDAARWSGGVPRTFLQLMADAGTYARMRRNADWPTTTDLGDAVADQEDSFLRLLLPGDTQAIRANVGTDGRELELNRKVRLMAHGLLLERLRERRPVLELHPLARRGLEGADANA